MFFFFSEWTFVVWTLYFILSSIFHFSHNKAVPCLQYDFGDPCSILVLTGTAVLGVLYFLCRFKDIIVASYFVTAIGVVLELTAISLHDNEMESVCSLFCTARISHRPFL